MPRKWPVAVLGAIALHVLAIAWVLRIAVMSGELTLPSWLSATLRSADSDASTLPADETQISAPPAREDAAAGTAKTSEVSEVPALRLEPTPQGPAKTVSPAPEPSPKVLDVVAPAPPAATDPAPPPAPAAVAAPSPKPTLPPVPASATNGKRSSGAEPNREQPVTSGHATPRASATRHGPFYRAVQAHLAAQEFVPPEQGRGVVLLRFTVLPGGAVQDIEVAQSSGHADVDALGKELVQAAAPFPKAPKTAERVEVPLAVE